MSRFRVRVPSQILSAPSIYKLLVNCIEHVKPAKKAGRPVVVDLNPNFDLLEQMRILQIQFLDDQGE